MKTLTLIATAATAIAVATPPLLKHTLTHWV